jgi:hypothetical protein
MHAPATRELFESVLVFVRAVGFDWHATPMATEVPPNPRRKIDGILGKKITMNHFFTEKQ